MVTPRKVQQFLRIKIAISVYLSVVLTQRTFEKDKIIAYRFVETFIVDSIIYERKFSESRTRHCKKSYYRLQHKL